MTIRTRSQSRHLRARGVQGCRGRAGRALPQPRGHAARLPGGRQLARALLRQGGRQLSAQRARALQHCIVLALLLLLRVAAAPLLLACVVLLACWHDHESSRTTQQKSKQKPYLRA
jgi:hypothetical protein